MNNLQGKININIKCECIDKDGNLKWIDNIELNNINSNKTIDNNEA